MIKFQDFVTEVRFSDKEIKSLETKDFIKGKLLYSKKNLELHFNEIKGQEYLLFSFLGFVSVCLPSLDLL